MRTTPLGPFWLRLLLVVGLALGLERLIVTDAEELEDLAREAAAAAQAGDRAGLEALLAADFAYAGRGREAALDEAERLWRRYRPARIEVDLARIEVEGDHAQALLALTLSGGQVGRLAVQVQVAFVREGGTWRFLKATLESFGR